LTRIAGRHNYDFSISKTGPTRRGPAERRRIMAERPRPTSTLGERVRRLRRERGMTLTQLARQSGISVSTLSKLENGLTGLNLDNVIRLAGGFAMPVSILLNDTALASGAHSVSRRGGAYSHEARELDFQVLHNDLPGQRNIFWKVRVKAHSLEQFGPYHSHPGEEFFYVLEGSVRFLIRERKPMELGPGDSVQFDSALDHAYISASREDALILMSNTITDIKLPGFVDWGTASRVAATRSHAARKAPARTRRKPAAAAAKRRSGTGGRKRR
jgi:transcriptional regulator with XRE-family HTH domain